MDEHPQAILTALQGKAEQREDLDVAWRAATAAIEILLWCDEFSRAAALSDRIIRDCGSEGTDLDDQLLPFTSAFLAAEAYGDEPAAPRANAACAALPSESPLGEHLVRVAESLRDSSALAVLSRRKPWEKTGHPLGKRQRDVLQRDWTELAGRDLDAVWLSASHSNDFELAQRIASKLGYAPTRWPCAEWFARWLIHDGQTERASEVLRKGRHGYLPYAWWSLLPIAPATDVHLRRALTNQVRQAFLADVHDPFVEVER